MGDSFGTFIGDSRSTVWNAFPPDTDTDLIIEWQLVWERSANRVFRLRPAFTSSAKVRNINLKKWGTPEKRSRQRFPFKEGARLICQSAHDEDIGRIESQPESI